MSNPPRAERYRVGELRPSQLLYTFGIGSIIDLPNLSVMVMGLDDWSQVHAEEVGEQRLLVAVQEQLGAQVQSLRMPPTTHDGNPDNPFDGSALVGVPVTTFPRWMVCPHCRLLAPRDSGLFQLKTDPMRPDRARYVHANCSRPGAPPTVLPARFLVACEKGHLDDFPWHYFVHQGPSECSGALRLREFGVSGEAIDISIECDNCKARRTMAEAFGDQGRMVMPTCRGRHPHVRDFDERCDQQMRPMLLGASNSWFGLTLTVLAVPQTADPLTALVAAQWHQLEMVTSRDMLPALRKFGVLNAFVNVSDDQLWTAIERKRNGTSDGELVSNTLKTPEWQVLTNPAMAPRLDDFQVRAVAAPPVYAALIERVVLVERLREVSACVGFTRITSPGDFAESGELPPDQRAPLSRKPPTWVSAVEVRGEGIFLVFDEQKIADWCARPAVSAYEQTLRRAHIQWRRARRISEPEAGFPGVRYALLHTFAHALMRQLALACGYTMASLRERIYALRPTDDDGPMAGVLIYTAAPDSEGTLGGLVSLGEPQQLDRHITAALQAMELCASDPLCAEHTPLVGPQTLHGAACHACLFVPETSCERGNRYLDRSLLIPTVHRADLAFFTL